MGEVERPYVLYRVWRRGGRAARYFEDLTEAQALAQRWEPAAAIQGSWRSYSWDVPLQGPDAAARATALDVLRVECAGEQHSNPTRDIHICPDCHGEGTVWSDEVVEAVARGIAALDHGQMTDEDWQRWWAWQQKHCRLAANHLKAQARAALDAMRAKLQEAARD